MWAVVVRGLGSTLRFAHDAGMRFPFPSALLCLATMTSALAETVKDREGAVRGDRAKLESSTRWNYEDPAKGFALAAKTGKPVLVVLRCVPCKACAGIDESVIAEDQIAPLLDQFVCVRVINANALDLSKFQFDYDLSFSALFFNADGTVYGRYGSWQHQRDPYDKTVTGFQKSLAAALAIHKGYPANKSSLAGKQGAPTPYRTPVEFPSLASKYHLQLDWEGKVVQSCVHCHMVGDAFRAFYREKKEPVPQEWIFPQPASETIGFSLAPDEVATVQSVEANTPSAKAGLLAGDKIVALNGQPLISMADVRWVLNRMPDAGTVVAKVERNGKPAEMKIELLARWREKSDISGRVGTWPMRGMAFGGLKVEDLDQARRKELGLGDDSMALQIMHVGEYGMHAAAKKAGFQKGDILLEVGGVKEHLTESGLIGRLLQEHKPGEKLPATVLRGSERVQLSLPQQ